MWEFAAVVKSVNSGAWALTWVSATHVHSAQTLFVCRHVTARAAIALEENPPGGGKVERLSLRLDEKLEERGGKRHLSSMEQALQEVVPSKQCIWKSWLLAVEFSGHKFDLQPSRKTL